MNGINQSIILSKISCPQCYHEKTVPISTFKNNTTVKCPKPDCTANFTYKINCVFDSHNYSRIAPHAFMHPLDRKAISALRFIPGFGFALRKMMKFGYEKILRVNAMADDVKVSPKTCSHIHDMAEQAAKCLGISIPDVYINQNPHPNAFTFGSEHPLITIQSGIIELLTEDELYAVIAHEMAHIKCDHVLYHMLADFLVNASGFLGLAGGFIIPLNLALLEWSRKAELSADRGALLVTNNQSASIKLLMKLAGGSERVAEMINEDEFVSQAEKFENITEGIGLNKFYRFISNITRTHPFPVLRAHELGKWAVGQEYESIYEGNYPERKGASATEFKDLVKCPHCGEQLNPEADYCDNCGQNPDIYVDPHGESGLKSLAARTKKVVEEKFKVFSGIYKQDILNTDKKVCPACGTEFFNQNYKVCPLDGNDLIEERRRSN